MTFSVPSGFYLGLGAAITATAGGPIDLSGATVALTGTTSTITGGNITFGSIINPDNTTTPDLTIQSSGTVILAAVGTSDSPIGSLTVTNNGSSAQPNTTLNGDIFVSGNAIFGGTVSLPVNVNISDGNQEEGDSGDVEFDGTLEGPGGLNVVDDTQTRINNNVGNVTPMAFLDFTPGVGGIVFFRAGSPGSSGLVLPATQQAATVVNIASGGNFEVNFGSSSARDFSDLFATVDSYGPLTVNIGSAGSPNAANLFAVGQNEEITVIGDLNIDTNGGTAEVGDLSSEGDMTITSPNIIFVLRDPTVEGSAKLDSGMDLIADGEISLPADANYSTVAPSGSGSFDVPGFIARSFDPSSNIAAIAASLNTVISVARQISRTAFFGPDSLLLDLTPATFGTTIPTFIPPIPFVFDLPIAGAVPRQDLVAGTVPADFKIAFQTAYPGPVLQQDLKDAGINTREPTADEILAAADGVVDYDDMPKKRRPRRGFLGCRYSSQYVPCAGIPRELSGDFRRLGNLRCRLQPQGADCHRYPNCMGCLREPERLQPALRARASSDTAPNARRRQGIGRPAATERVIPATQRDGAKPQGGQRSVRVQHSRQFVRQRHARPRSHCCRRKRRHAAMTKSRGMAIPRVHRGQHGQRILLKPPDRHSPIDIQNLSRRIGDLPRASTAAAAHIFRRPPSFFHRQSPCDQPIIFFPHPRGHVRCHNSGQIS